jgi:hypothetical protein
MKILSKLFDRRIRAYNILTEFSIFQYLEIAKDILQNNALQRKRVKSSSSVYSLLREDLKSGCTIPPLVLALSNENFESSSINQSDASNDEIINYINTNIKRLIILDGLQRTYTLIDVERELKQQKNEDTLDNFYNHKLRFEIYLGINKLGILYRMLTLNTGQSPMSLRHQVEILYSDYLDHNIKGIQLIREVDEENPSQLGEYRFNDIINGFTSYILRDESTLDRSDLLDNIKSLEKLALESQDQDLFQSYLNSYHNFIVKMNDIAGDWTFDEQIDLSGRPFGSNVLKIFNKPQVMTGFGASVGFLKDKNLIESFDDIFDKINSISLDSKESLNNIILKLDDIRKTAKKIGNAQRMYFYYFFRDLFNSASDSFLSVDESIESSYKRYKLNE